MHGVLIVMHHLLIIALLTLLPLQFMTAYESAFPKTEEGTIEIKTLPEARLLVAHGESNYFKENSKLFGTLFRYIQVNEIAMTVPVEAEMDPGSMYFYIGDDLKDTHFETTAEVDILELPERTVLSIGVRGSYNAKNFAAARKSLLDYLATQENWIAAGSARAIYWNGPFTPGLLKRSEVHIPIKAAEE